MRDKKAHLRTLEDKNILNQKRKKMNWRKETY